MILTIKINPLTMQFEGPLDFADWVDKLGRGEMDRALIQKTRKDQRFYEGKAMAYKDIAILLRNMTISGTLGDKT